MEFSISGKLDENGQLQSVQSRCAQSGIMPVGGALVGLPCPGDGAEPRENKVVNYSVKKELDRKLHTKVDEVSQLVLQLAHAQETNEMLRKLVKEYEEKIGRYETQIGQLQDANTHLVDLLHIHGIPVTDSDSLTSMHASSTRPKVVFDDSCGFDSFKMTSGTSPKILQSSTTEVTIGLRHSTISMTESLYSKPEVHTNSTTDISDEYNAIDGNCVSSKPASNTIHIGSCSKPNRPNKLDIPKAFTRSPPVKMRQKKTAHNDDNDDSSPDNDETNKHGPDYIDTVDGARSAFGNRTNQDIADAEHNETMDTSGKPQTTRDSVSANEGAQKNSEDLSQDSFEGYTHNSSWFPLDRFGYFILKLPTNATFNQNGTKHNPDNKPEVGVANGGQCSCAQCHDNNQVHVTWLDFHNCRNSCGSPISPKDAEQNHTKLPDTEIPKPPTPVKERHTIDKKSNSHYVEILDHGQDVVGDKEASVTETDKDLDEKYAMRAPQPLPSPSTPTGGSRPRSGLWTSGTSTTPVDTSPDTRKVEDIPNSVMKLMRMTSEWNSTKKKLLEKSVTSTSQDADNTLGAVVKKTIERFQKTDNTKRRGSKNLSDKLVKSVKESLKDKHDNDDVITTEFLEKCVQLCEREFS